MTDLLSLMLRLKDLGEFLHLSSAGVFYFIIAIFGFTWLYRRQSKLTNILRDHELDSLNRLHDFDKRLSDMKMKKDLNKVSYDKQEERHNLLFNNALKVSRAEKLRSWRR